MRDGRNIGQIDADKRQRRLDAEKFGKPRLEMAVGRALSADKPRSERAYAELVERESGGCPNLRMGGKPQIVVIGEAHNPAATGLVSRRRLSTGAKKGSPWSR